MNDGRDEKITHESFGTVLAHRISGGHNRLFGTPLIHDAKVAITIHEASLTRQLHNDWIYGGKIIAEVHMSEAQWAQFVSSMNVGSGVPCTVRYRCTGPFKAMEDLPKVEGTKAQFSREVQEKATKYVAEARAAVAKLDALLKGGPIRKRDIEELRDLLNNVATGLPNNLKFSMDQFDEAMESAVAAGKADLEAHFMRVVVNAGMATLQGAVGAPKLIDTADE